MELPATADEARRFANHERHVALKDPALDEVTFGQRQGSMCGPHQSVKAPCDREWRSILIIRMGTAHPLKCFAKCRFIEEASGFVDRQQSITPKHAGVRI